MVHLVKKNVYCHTSQKSFIKDKWYVVYYETDNFYIIKELDGNVVRFYKNILDKNLLDSYFSSFSELFYTDQEYNRIKNLEELIN